MTLIAYLSCAELYYDRGDHYEFSSVVRELDTAGTLIGNRVSAPCLSQRNLEETYKYAEFYVCV